MNLVTLYRPVNQDELKLIEECGYTKFPPRLYHQPIFYPVTNKEYAIELSEWNVSAYGKGYVTEFDVNKDYLDKYQTHNVGGMNHNEYWIPSEDLNEFNQNIIGLIRITHKVELTLKLDEEGEFHKYILNI